MIIASTINIDTLVRLRLERAARILGMSKSMLIVQLMRQLSLHYDNDYRYPHRVRYQRCFGSGRWTTLHISVDHREYERFLDLRKFYKRSVSSLIAFAIIHYLNELIQNRIQKTTRNNNTDNYLFQNYIIINEITEDAICWRIYWGLPPKLDLSQNSYLQNNPSL